MCKKALKRILKRIDPHIAWIARQWYTQRWFLILMILFTLGNSAVSVAFPMLFRRLIDTLKDILPIPITRSP